MPKYYIKSGEIKYIIDSPNHTTAILAVLQAYKQKKTMRGPKICVSEKGFKDYKSWKCYDTYNFLKDQY
jgi:hypothetical protein